MSSIRFGGCGVLVLVTGVLLLQLFVSFACFVLCSSLAGSCMHFNVLKLKIWALSVCVTM